MKGMGILHDNKCLRVMKSCFSIHEKKKSTNKTTC